MAAILNFLTLLAKLAPMLASAFFNFVRHKNDMTEERKTLRDSPSKPQLSTDLEHAYRAKWKAADKVTYKATYKEAFPSSDDKRSDHEQKCGEEEKRLGNGEHSSAPLPGGDGLRQSDGFRRD